MYADNMLRTTDLERAAKFWGLGLRVLGCRMCSLRFAVACFGPPNNSCRIIMEHETRSGCYRVYRDSKVELARLSKSWSRFGHCRH